MLYKMAQRPGGVGFMWRFLLLELGKFVLWLAGAVLGAAALASLSAPHGGWNFLSTFPSHVAAYLHGEFGRSSIEGLPAMQMAVAGLPATLELLLCGAAIALAAGVPLAIAVGRGPIRRATVPFIQFIGSAPVFCGGLALAWAAFSLFHWRTGASGDVGLALGFPSALLRGDVAAAAAGLHQLILPALTVGAAGAASVHLAMRRAAATTDSESYRQGLKLMGLGALEIERVYVWPRIFAGLLSGSGEIVLTLISAAAVAEWVFGWPGDAVLFVKSVALSDWSVAALVLLVFAALKFSADFAGAVAARALEELHT